MLPEMKTKWHDLTKLSGPRGREDAQAGWHAFIGRKYANQSILDVGAGLGLSRERMQMNNGVANGNRVTLQDLGPGLAVDLRCDVSEISDQAYDLVTCFDVLEHVLDPLPFVTHLARIAKFEAFITTPNWDVFHAGNDFHCCEYTPQQLLYLFKDLHVVELWTADPQGYQPQPRTQNAFLALREPALAVLFRSK